MVDEASASIRRAIELYPSSPLRPVLRFYLGCLTGEHGVGIEKRDLMTVQFDKVDLDQQMRVRAVFDPHWLLNPAKVFPLEGRIAA